VGTDIGDGAASGDSVDSFESSTERRSPKDTVTHVYQEMYHPDSR
jgi:hypothetical protein